MFDWLSRNLATIIIAVSLFGVLALIVRKLIHDRRKGVCCSGCPGCAGACAGKCGCSENACRDKN